MWLQGLCLVAVSSVISLFFEFLTLCLTQWDTVETFFFELIWINKKVSPARNGHGSYFLSQDNVSPETEAVVLCTCTDTKCLPALPQSPQNLYGAGDNSCRLLLCSIMCWRQAACGTALQPTQPRSVQTWKQKLPSRSSEKHQAPVLPIKETQFILSWSLVIVKQRSLAVWLVFSCCREQNNIIDVHAKVVNDGLEDGGISALRQALQMISHLAPAENNSPAHYVLGQISSIFWGVGFTFPFFFFIFVPVSPAVGDRWWMSQHIGPRRPRNNRKWFHFNFRCVPVFVFCQTCSELSTDELVLPLWTGRFCSCLIFISSLIFLVEHLLIFFFLQDSIEKEKEESHQRRYILQLHFIMCAIPKKLN